MFTFCDVLHEVNKKRKQTFESAQYGLEIIVSQTVVCYISFPFSRRGDKASSLFFASFPSSALANEHQLRRLYWPLLLSIKF